ncbi:MAG: UDP-N-acetylmuramate--L-alanine ligase [Candidatus Gracilibacteria bacterium]|nr:UDP-N-acetylmuramate--L-alanine ligase [Candidatus Gracilibacteria bacterium]
MQKDKIYIIGIGGIGISALARYYLTQSFTVYGSDKSSSELIEKLKDEGINITIGENPELINNDFDLVIYSEAIPENNSERKKALSIGIETISYPKALAKIANQKKLITIAGTHGKSTTTSMTSLILKNSDIDFTSIVGTLIKEFGNKNFYHRRDTQEQEYFVIEACEYKKSFLNYKPTVGIITNIELDHIDYYKNLDNYIEAFKEYLENILPGGFAIINGEDTNCKKLIGLRTDINYIEIYKEHYSYNGQLLQYPIIDIKVPGEHIKFDSKIAYVIGHMIGINDKTIIDSLEKYSGVWRRMERIGTTVHNNILISDYGHHPTEISLTLKSIKESNLDKKILTIFQPHQYSRTIELIEDFKNCFKYTDKLIIPNIYESRDTETDKQKIDTQKFVELINHKDKIDGKGLNNTLKLIEEFDKNNSGAIILLLGAGDIDNLRYKIKTVY